MKSSTKPISGLPSDPKQALRARQLLAYAQELMKQHKIAEAARVSVELVDAAPQLSEAHGLMGILAMRTGAAEIAAISFERAIALKPRSAALAVSLGQALIAAGQPQRAADFLEKSRSLHPNDAKIFRELGQAQLDLGDQKGAQRSFSRALKLSPSDQYAAHMVGALSEVGAANAAYVSELFDSYAGSFDAHLTGKLQYRVPEAICALVAKHAQMVGPTLDVGCGTGLAALALPEAARPIDGIDIAPKMVEKASDRGLYRHLHIGDATAVLSAQPDLAGPYGLVISTDVFIYIGEIAPLFPLIADRLTAGGILAFSVETNDGAGIAIRSSGRFAHAPDYIRNLAAAHRFAILAEEPHTIRLESDKPIPGQLFVLRRE